MMIISSGDVMCASVVMRAGLKRNMSIHAIVELFKKAADKLYTAKSFTEQEMGLGLLFLRLGGAWLTGIAHQALGLPAVRTLQYACPTQSLLVSSHLPMTLELEENISVSLNAGLFNKESSTIADALSKTSVSCPMTGCVTCHTHHASVTDFRPISGHTVEVAHMTSSVMYIH